MMTKRTSDTRPTWGTSANDSLTTERLRELEEENARLSLLHDVIVRLQQSVGWAEVLNAVLEICVGRLGATSVLVLEPASRPRIVAASGTGDESLSVAIESSVRSVVATGVAMVERGDHDRGPGAPIAVVPLCAAREVIGAIVVVSLRPYKQELTAAEEEALLLLGRQAGLMLQLASVAASRPTLRPPPRGEP